MPISRSRLDRKNQATSSTCKEDSISIDAPPMLLASVPMRCSLGSWLLRLSVNQVNRGALIPSALSLTVRVWRLRTALLDSLHCYYNAITSCSDLAGDPHSDANNWYPHGSYHDPSCNFSIDPQGISYWKPCRNVSSYGSVYDCIPMQRRRKSKYFSWGQSTLLHVAIQVLAS